MESIISQLKGSPLGGHPQAFERWLNTPLGQYVMAYEQAFFERAVADVFGYYAVQLELPQYNLLANNRIPTQVYAGLSPACQLSSDPTQLPFPANSIDLLVLPHTLDFHHDPRAVLREAERVLVPEGRLILSGFNLLSLWGGARLVQKRRGQPWSGQFIALPRLKDWLALLSLEPTSSSIGCYAPPLYGDAWRRRFAFMDRLGARWWPVAGGVYCLSVVKRVRSMRLIAPGWKKAVRVGARVAVSLPDSRRPQTVEKQAKD